MPWEIAISSNDCPYKNPVLDPKKNEMVITCDFEGKGCPCTLKNCDNQVKTITVRRHS